MTFWDRIAGLYDLAESTNGKAVRGMIAAVAERVPAGADFLECAAGTGEISLAVAKKARRVVCTDLSQPMLDRAGAKAKRQGLNNLSFAQRNLLRLDEADGAYGAVCAANVLHLLDQPEAAVRELLRVTAPGGVVLLPTFLMGEAGPLMEGLIRFYRLLGFRQKCRFTRESYRAFFTDMGLEPEELAIVDGRLPVGLAVLRKPKGEEPL